MAINFKSSAIETIVQEIVETKGNLSFYKTKNYMDMYPVINKLMEMHSSDTVYAENDFQNTFLPNLYSAELGTVHVKDTTVYNKILTCIRNKPYS